MIFTKNINFQAYNKIERQNHLFINIKNKILSICLFRIIKCEYFILLILLQYQKHYFKEKKEKLKYNIYLFFGIKKAMNVAHLKYLCY